METKYPLYARIALILLALVLSVFILSYASGVFIPIVFSLLISALLYPLCKFFEVRLHFPRFVASLICVLLFILLIAGFIYFITFQVVNFSKDLPHLQQRVQELLNDFQTWVNNKYHIDSEKQVAYLDKSATGIVSTAANSLTTVFTSVATLAIWTIFVFIYTYFMLVHRRLLLSFVLHLFSPKYRVQVNEAVNETRGMINNYVLGLLTEMVVISILNCTVLSILGIRYAILLGVVAAVLNIIPYLGIYTGMAIGMLVTFANSSATQAVELAIALIVIHFVDANMLMPRIVGSRVKMNPLITIITVLVGHLIWGIPGMFLFIPIMGIIKIISERVESLQAWAILIGVEEKDK
jgi:predicted PurR-regulated permease PerM